MWDKDDWDYFGPLDVEGNNMEKKGNFPSGTVLVNPPMGSGTKWTISSLLSNPALIPCTNKYRIMK